MRNFKNFIQIGITGFGHSFADHINPIEKGILGHGISLVLLDIPNNRDRYGNLYRNGIKLSDKIFRIGGLCSGFSGKSYCGLIHYDAVKSFGRHCIIDANGDIVLMQEERSLDYPYYLKGCIAVIKDHYYNLITKELICKGSSNVSSETYLFVANSYNFDSEKYKSEIGVYKIRYSTGEFEIFK